MNNPAMTDHVQQCLQVALQTVDQEKHGYVQTPHLLEALFEVDHPWLLSLGRAFPAKLPSLVKSLSL